jgi:hypothetical protein
MLCSYLPYDESPLLPSSHQNYAQRKTLKTDVIFEIIIRLGPTLESQNKMGYHWILMPFLPTKAE